MLPQVEKQTAKRLNQQTYKLLKQDSAVVAAVSFFYIIDNNYQYYSIKTKKSRAKLKVSNLHSFLHISFKNKNEPFFYIKRGSFYLLFTFTYNSDLCSHSTLYFMVLIID